MHKIIILFITIFVFFNATADADNIIQPDLSNFQKGGKIVSPSGTYRSGGFRPSQQFTGFLKKLGLYLKTNTQLIVDIRGHSDDQGTERINKNISAKRARFAKEIILESSGIKNDRIIDRGYSDHFPVKSNKSEAGRMENRRVEIFLTNNLDPVGTITHIKNRVFTKSPGENDFKKAEIFEALFNLYKLNTRKRSGANIRLSDDSRLNIGPESLMVIYEMIESELANPDAWQDKKVKLLTGFLRTKLNDLRKGIKIETPQCEINSRSKIMLVDISEKAQSSVSVFEGLSDVSAENKTVSVKSGFGTFVEKGKEPAKPEPLPIAPQIISPEKGKSFLFKNEKESRIRLEWNSQEPLNHLQISEDAEFTKIVVDEKLSGSFLITDLPGGQYFWRIAGINSNGIEGFPTDAGFKITIRKNDLPITTTPAVKHTPIDAHGSTHFTDKSSIIITGTTVPGTTLSIARGTVSVDQNGKFSEEIYLSWGWNLIKVTAAHPDYLTKEQWISVCYFKKAVK